MRIAYADPPYPGTAHRYGRREVNHPLLIRALERFDGWALSTTSTALKELLPHVPDGARIGAFCKTYAVTHPGPWPPTYAWEPVIFKPARRPKKYGTADRPFVRDWVRAGPGFGYLGLKPPEFCGWLFEILAMEPEDELHDLFHGSGAVKKSWKQWRQIKAAGGPLFVKN